MRGWPVAWGESWAAGRGRPGLWSRCGARSGRSSRRQSALKFGAKGQCVVWRSQDRQQLDCARMGQRSRLARPDARKSPALERSHATPPACGAWASNSGPARVRGVPLRSFCRLSHDCGNCLVLDSGLAPAARTPRTRRAAQHGCGGGGGGVWACSTAATLVAGSNIIPKPPRPSKSPATATQPSRAFISASHRAECRVMVGGALPLGSGGHQPDRRRGDL